MSGPWRFTGNYFPSDKTRETTLEDNYLELPTRGMVHFQWMGYRYKLNIAGDLAWRGGVVENVYPFAFSEITVDNFKPTAAERYTAALGLPQGEWNELYLYNKMEDIAVTGTHVPDPDFPDNSYTGMWVKAYVEIGNSRTSDEYTPDGVPDGLGGFTTETPTYADDKRIHKFGSNWRVPFKVTLIGGYTTTGGLYIPDCSAETANVDPGGIFYSAGLVDWTTDTLDHAVSGSWTLYTSDTAGVGDSVMFENLVVTIENFTLATLPADYP